MTHPGPLSTWLNLLCISAILLLVLGAELVRGGWQVALLGAGLLVMLATIFLVNQWIITPLRRMTRCITAMQQTGRLIKLPVMKANELGVVAEGFNHLAQQVEEQKRRLREHIEELQRVNVELDQLANMKDDFLTTINHQLRTPLTAIMEGLELLRDGAVGTLSEDQKDFVQIMDRNAGQLANLVENALDLSLLKSGRRPLGFKPDDLDRILRDTLAAWQALGPSRTIRLQSDELPTIYMDAKAIRDVLDHLLRNALRYAPEQSEVTIAARVQDGMAVVSVQDHGPGISPAQLARLFQPFVHVQTPDAPGSQGSGLGLAYCRQVIERHRGSIRADSVEGQGTTLMFTLPVASPRFLFEEICRTARDEAELEHGEFGLVLVGVSSAPARGAAETLMQRAGTLLRNNTHHGDRFVWLDALTLAIVAVTNQAGLTTMVSRLRGIVERAGFEVQLGGAVCPHDASGTEQLLVIARSRMAAGQGVAPLRAASSSAPPSGRLSVTPAAGAGQAGWLR